jgi:hypothetical protein
MRKNGFMLNREKERKGESSFLLFMVDVETV